MKRIKVLLNRFPYLRTIIADVYWFLGRNRYRVKGRNNSISKKGAFLKRSKVEVLGHRNKIILAPLIKMDNLHLYIKGDDNVIHIGRECVGRELEIWIEDSENVVSIGSNTWITGKTHLAVTEGTELCIGERCLFAEDVTVRTGDSHSILNVDEVRINEAKNIKIGNHVWLGNKSIVLKGSEIGSESVVGTAAVVTKTFPEHVVVAGNPARVVKTDICWDSERL